MRVILPTIGHLLNKKRCTVFSADFLPGSEECIGTGGQDGLVQLWRVSETDSHELGKYAKHSGAVLCLRFSPNGQALASGSDDGSVVVWGVEEKDSAPRLYCRKVLADHRSDVSSIAWSGKYLATGSYDGTVLVYDAGSLALVKRLEKHEKECKGLAFSPGGKYLATYGDEGEVIIYGQDLVKIGSTKKPFKGTQLASFFGRMSWSPDGKYLGCGLAFLERKDAVAIITSDLAQEYTLIGHIAPTEIVAFSPRVWEKDGAKQYILVTGSQDRSIAVWGSGSSKPVVLLREVAEQPIMDLQWSTTGSALVGCSYDGAVFVVRFEPGELGEPSVPELYQGKKVAYSREALNPAELAVAFPEHSRPENQAAADDSGLVAEPKKEKRKIVPRVIAPLEMARGTTAVGPRVVLFVPQKEAGGVKEDACPAELQTEISGRVYKIQIDRESSIVRVVCQETEWFVVAGIAPKMAAAHQEICVVVGRSYSEKKQFESVWVYNIQRCVQVLPAMAFAQVMSVDVLDGQVLVVLPHAFKVIDLESKAVVEGQLVAHGAVVNVVLDKRYFLLALYQDGTTQFYHLGLSSWLVLELCAPSVFSETFAEETEIDATFEALENRYLVGVDREEWGMVEDALTNLVLSAGRATECTPGVLNRIDGIIEHFLETTKQAGASLIQTLLSSSTVANSKALQKFAYYKLKELQSPPSGCLR